MLVNDESTNRKIDKKFFGSNISEVRSKGAVNSIGSFSLSKKHGNRNKREKTRRLFAHLDA